ncbi:hypothetical protein MPH_04339 [Macrophomina phaseolina MS6]|uniref:Uncharacterized protein n=1 Tax=Macrophomina phaseolina (strain MS6) TaxID=1126212 RepID=K2S0U5_MACPH|nr:hypothetical protein MPH_04339 [Macrophomina phaseolina MS6]
MPSSPDGSFADPPFPGPRRPHRRTSQSVAEEDDVQDLRQRRSRRSRPMQRVPPWENQGGQPTLLQSTWTNVLMPIVRYAFSVLAFALEVLKPVISIALAAMLFAVLLSFARAWLHSSVSTALTPICYVPGASYLGLPFCGPAQKSSYASDPAGSVEFDELMNAQQAFEEILASASMYDGLPGEMKQGQMAIADLRTVVRYSKLPSKSELDLEFNHFIGKAKDASVGLTNFNARIGRTTDKIITTHKWTLQVVDGVGEVEEGRGSVNRFIWDHLLWGLAPHRSAYDRIVSQYLRHTQTIEEEIVSLIAQADALLSLLDSLEDHLSAIHDISVRDDASLRDKREELFLSLWTKLGGNRSDVKKLNNQIMMLKSFNAYRRSAVSHVSSTVLKLRAIAASLEDMRERASMPDLAGMENEMPIVLHIENLKRGLERLEDTRQVHQKTREDNAWRILDAAEAGDLPTLHDGGSPKERMIDSEKARIG